MASAPPGDPCGRLARRGALEDVAHVGDPVLLDAGEVGMAGARQMDLGGRCVDRPRVHPLLPVGVVAVGDLERDRSAERSPVADARGDDDVVRLDLHPAAAAVTELAAGHVPVDRLAVEHGVQRAGPGRCRSGRGPCDSPAVVSSSSIDGDLSLRSVGRVRGGLVGGGGRLFGRRLALRASSPAGGSGAEARGRGLGRMSLGVHPGDPGAGALTPRAASPRGGCRPCRR